MSDSGWLQAMLGRIPELSTEEIKLAVASLLRMPGALLNPDSTANVLLSAYRAELERRA